MVAHGSLADRILRLHSFEILIFVVMFVLIALCLNVVSVFSKIDVEIVHL